METPTLPAAQPVLPASEPPIRRMRLGTLLAISAYWLATNLHWGALLMIIIPSQVKTIAPAHRGEAAGLVEGIGAVMALIVPLVVGALSDRCASGWGRRRPYIVFGATVNVAGLALLYYAGLKHSLWLYIIGFVIVQVGNNIATGAYSGVIPDIVPESQRGQASGYMAAMTQVGTILGALGAGQLMSAGQVTAAFLAIAVTLAVCVAVTVTGVRETPLSCRPERLDWRVFLKSLWIDPRKHPDFAWVWITRFLVTLGMWTVQPFIQYYLADVLGVKEPEKTTGYLLGIILIGATITGVLGGSLSDRIGRKRVVYVANSIIALASVGFIFCHELKIALIVGLIYGLGYGAYYSVDWALGCDVLPNKDEHAAKDMAVWHIAMVLPQSLAAPLAGKLLASFGQSSYPGPDGPIYQYTLNGYTAIFSLAAFFLILGAVLLRNVRGAR